MEHPRCAAAFHTDDTTARCLYGIGGWIEYTLHSPSSMDDTTVTLLNGPLSGAYGEPELSHPPLPPPHSDPQQPGQA